jgi:kynurenine formamidase
MRYINLTLPLYPYMPVGNVWAWDSPFEMNQVTSIPTHGIDFYQMSFHSETGTRLMLGACYDSKAPKLDELDYIQFVNRPTIVVDIPKNEFEEIRPEDIDNSLAIEKHFNDGDAVLIRTGWGNDNRYKLLEDQYAIRSPHFSVEGAKRLIEVMKFKHSDLMLTDCAYIGNTGEKFMRPEWASRQPWDRPPFPSQQARIYMRYYREDLGKGGKSEDWAASVPLHAHLSPVAALANCGAISTKRIKITLLPLYMEGASGAPCSVIGIEE